MAEQTQTPGPWKTDPDTQGESVLGPDGSMVADCCITCFEGNRSNETNRSNARLISAAPDLLAALLMYVEIEETAAPASSSPLREQARAAIRKATAK